MKIAIVDIDFQNKIARFPNPFLMKISSYHKQQKDTVIFEDYSLNTKEYNKIYVGRMLEASDPPPLALVLADNVEHIYCDIDQIENESFFKKPWALARPDYLLYKFEYPSEYTEANFLQFSYKGELIKTQDSKQYYLANPINIIMDKNLWSLPKEELLQVLREVKFLKKIYFLFPIDFSRFFDDDILDAFLEIPLTPRLEQKFSNFAANHLKIIKVMKRIKESNKMLAYIRPYIEIYPESNDYKSTWDQFINILEIGVAAKSEGVRLDIRIKQPTSNEALLLLQKWSRGRESLLNYASQSARRKYCVIAAEALSTPDIWDTNLTIVAEALTKHPSLLDNIITGWNGVMNDITKLNIDKIKEGVNDLPILRL